MKVFAVLAGLGCVTAVAMAPSHSHAAEDGAEVRIVRTGQPPLRATGVSVRGAYGRGPGGADSLVGSLDVALALSDARSRSFDAQVNDSAAITLTSATVARTVTQAELCTSDAMGCKHCENKPIPSGFIAVMHRSGGSGADWRAWIDWNSAPTEASVVLRVRVGGQVKRTITLTKCVPTDYELAARRDGGFDERVVLRCGDGGQVLGGPLDGLLDDMSAGRAITSVTVGSRDAGPLGSAHVSRYALADGLETFTITRDTAADDPDCPR